MSGPNPPGRDSGGADLPGEEPGRPSPDDVTSEVPDAGTFDAGGTEEYPRAYSAPESEQFVSAPYVAADTGLYDYDSYDAAAEPGEPQEPPRWPWVVGVVAIVAAVALVVSVSVLVTRTDTDSLATPSPTTTTLPPVQDEITTT
ncbi:hypothetical protein ACQI4G_02515, partial [Mycolicibacterium vaccae]